MHNYILIYEVYDVPWPSKLPTPARSESFFFLHISVQFFFYLLLFDIVLYIRSFFYWSILLCAGSISTHTYTLSVGSARSLPKI